LLRVFRTTSFDNPDVSGFRPSRMSDRRQMFHLFSFHLPSYFNSLLNLRCRTHSRHCDAIASNQAQLVGTVENRISNLQASEIKTTMPVDSLRFSVYLCRVNLDDVCCPCESQLKYPSCYEKCLV